MLLIFNNGLYLSDCDKFYKNDDIPEKFKQFIDKECTYDSHENFVSKVYLDFNFEVYSSNIVSEILIKKKKIPKSICNLISSYHNNWYNIPTPTLDQILDNNLNSNQKVVFYILLGRIFHQFARKENWNIVPIFFDKSGMFIHFIQSILGGTRLCVGRGIEHIITDGDIWLGIVSILTCNGTSPKSLSNIITKIINGNPLSISRILYNEQNFILEDLNIIFIQELRNEKNPNNFQQDIKLILENKIQSGNVIYFNFKSNDNNVHNISNLIKEFPLFIQKTNRAYLQAINSSYSELDILKLMS